MDIGYEDRKTIRGNWYILMLVDDATRYVWCYGLCSLTILDVVDTLSSLFVNGGGFLCEMHCNFDMKFLSCPVCCLLASHGCHLKADPQC